MYIQALMMVDDTDDEKEDKAHFTEPMLFIVVTNRKEESRIHVGTTWRISLYPTGTLEPE
jgi:hypothetical protein